MRSRFTIRQIAVCAIIAAVYSALTVATSAISYGPIQFRLSEALCILPFFFPVTTWGLFVGCLLANIFSPVSYLDIVIGSLATLMACLVTSKIRIKWLAPLPPVIFNGVMIGMMIAWTSTPESFALMSFVYGGQVALGEFAVMYLLGLPLLTYLPKARGLMSFLESSLNGPLKS